MMREIPQRLPFERRSHSFFRSPLAGGIVLLACLVVAVVLTNLEATGQWYLALWKTQFTIGFEGFSLSASVESWINNALMAVFFFTIGLEIKREFVAGDLRSPTQALLPIGGAIGGMVVPALVFTYFNYGLPTAPGWGIPMATDIVFTIGILSLMGSRVPVSVKVTLAALAIVDDLGAVVEIAIFYTHQVNWPMLVAAAVVFTFLLILSRMRVYSLRWYLVPAVALWLLFLHSGVHATIAGVLVALAIPAGAEYSKENFYGGAKKLVDLFKSQDINHVEVLSNDPQRSTLGRMVRLSSNSISPNQRLYSALHPTVTFLIMPLFALCNAGVVVPSGAVDALWSPLSMGIILGLVAGKPLGIMSMVYVVIRLGLASMPSKSTWGIFWGVSCLAGIGFTMSIFIGRLAFSDPSLVSEAQIAIFVASIISGLLGVSLLLVFGLRGR